VLVVDMFNTYDHADAEPLARHVESVLEPVASLVAEARRRDDVDLIYVNDNHGDFSAQFTDIVAAARRGRRPDLVEPILPDRDCRMLTKVRHSVFYATALDYLLGQLGTRRVVLVGQVTEQCILYSALDAYVRHFDLVVPADAVAHIDAELGDAALKMMETNMHAAVLPAAHSLDRPA